MGLVALVADDSMLIRHTVCRFLEERGFAVVAVSNGQEAIDKLQELRPSIVITDIMMPKIDGTQLITALKKSPDTAKIPIVIVAGRNSGFEHTEKRANFVIFKDIDVESQLKNALSAIFGTKAAAGKS
ncbi:MAG: response regulator [Acidobacteria bacterium]|nr:response regulator [Acidobacteriota bacterium]MBV9481434.1 response regulator [Acidobacteriota bacterium]